MFHAQDPRSVIAPRLLHRRDFRRALVFGGGFCSVFWLATAYVAVRLFLAL